MDETGTTGPAPVPDVGLRPLVLRRAVAALDAAVAALVRPHGLTVDQWRMLELLVARGPSSMAVLAEELSLPAATATRVADRLVTRAVLYRGIDPADRRRVVLRTAKRGGELHRRLAPEVARAQERALRLLAADDRAPFPGLRRALLPDPPTGPTTDPPTGPAREPAPDAAAGPPPTARAAEG